jgi:hypothetical protein
MQLMPWRCTDASPVLHERCCLWTGDELLGTSDTWRQNNLSWVSLGQNQWMAENRIAKIEIGNKTPNSFKPDWIREENMSIIG